MPISAQIVSGFLFYGFAAAIILSAVLVVSSRNPVYAVLWLIFGFFNAGGLFVMLGAEFLAMLLIIVYVGAVAVLFLFVVMMLNINVERAKNSLVKYAPLALILAAILLVEIIAILYTSPQGDISPSLAISKKLTNTHAIANVLYTDYILPFQLAGLILLVAMIGAIVLTLRTRQGVRKQRIATQLARDPKTAIEIKQVESGKGI